VKTVKQPGDLMEIRAVTLHKKLRAALDRAVKLDNQYKKAQGVLRIYPELYILVSRNNGAPMTRKVEEMLVDIRINDQKTAFGDTRIRRP
jgi:hypothetical protein